MTKKFIGRSAILSVVLIMLALASIWFGLWIPNAPPERTYPVRGIDVSHHQGPIDWRAVAESGVHFAYIKATEGCDFQDADFFAHWNGAGRAGIARGAYHFFTFGTPGKEQAANFAAVVPVEPHSLPPAVDLEISGYNRSYQQSPEAFQRELNDFST